MQGNYYNRITKTAQEKAEKELKAMFEDSKILEWAKENSLVLYSRIVLDIKQVAFTELKFRYLKEEILIEKINLIEKKAVLKQKLGIMKSQIKPWEEGRGLSMLLSVFIESLFKIGLSIIPIISVLLIINPEPSKTLQINNPLVLISILCGVGLVQFLSNSVYKWLLAYPEESNNYWQRSAQSSQEVFPNSNSTSTATPIKNSTDQKNPKLVKNEYFAKIKGKSFLLLMILFVIIALEAGIGFSIIQYSFDNQTYNKEISRIDDKILEIEKRQAGQSTINSPEIEQLNKSKNKITKPEIPAYSLVFSSSIFAFANIFYSISKAFRDYKIRDIKKLIGRYKAELSAITWQVVSYNKMYKEIDVIHSKLSYKGDRSDEKIMLDRYRSLLYGKTALVDLVEDYESIIARIATINSEPKPTKSAKTQTT